jgi:hypothetical protein
LQFISRDELLVSTTSVLYYVHYLLHKLSDHWLCEKALNSTFSLKN